MPFYFESEFSVFHFECDAWARMTPGSFLRRVQEIAFAHSDSVGIDADFHEKHGTGFMMTRVSLHINKMPRPNQRVKLQTRAYGMLRAQYHRFTVLYDEFGEVLCEADIRWVLIDTKNKRILRKPMPELEKYFNEIPKDEHEMRMVKPIDEPQTVKELVATYTMCDRYKHINNTRYADIMCDSLPLDVLEKSSPKKMLLFYRSEIPLDKAFTLKKANIEQGGYYFVAQDNVTKFFEATVEF